MAVLKIGIVAEGISDYWIIKYIVGRFLKVHQIQFVPLQPKITSSGKQDGYGGWHKVFEYINKKEYIIDLAQTEGCDYIIIQLDTDVCCEYGIKNHTHHETLYHAVSNKINEITHPDFDKSKIIPAVCIHSIECWLLSFVSKSNSQCKKVNNCVTALNWAISKEEKGQIDEHNKGDAENVYLFILKQKRKPNEIEVASQYNFGFQKFIESISLING